MILETLAHRVKSQFSLEDLLYYVSIPVEKHVVKKNSRPIFQNKVTGRPFIGKDKGLQSAENHLILHMRSALADYQLNTPLNQPVWLIAHFFFPKEDFYTQKGVISQKLPDLSNLIQLPEDCLVTAGILKDDTLIHSLDLSRRLLANEYRLDLFLLKFDVSHALAVHTDKQQPHAGQTASS